MIYSQNLHDYFRRYDDIYFLNTVTVNEKQRYFYTFNPVFITRGLKILNVDTITNEVTVSKGAAYIDNVLVTLDNDTTIQSTTSLSTGCFAVIYYFNNDPQNQQNAKLMIVSPDDPILKDRTRYVFIGCIENGSFSHPTVYAPPTCCGMVRREFYFFGRFDKNISFFRYDTQLSTLTDYFLLPKVPAGFNYFYVYVNGILLKEMVDFQYLPPKAIKFTPRLEPGDYVSLIFLESLPDSTLILNQGVEPYPELRLEDYVSTTKLYYGFSCFKNKIFMYQSDYYRFYPFDNFNLMLKDQIVPNKYYTFEFKTKNIKLFALNHLLYNNLEPALFIIDYEDRIWRRLRVFNGKLVFEQFFENV